MDDAEMTDEGIDANNGAEPVRVVLVDDHDLFRGGLRDILQDQGIEVIGEASDGERGVRLVSELAPDVAVMDLNMPGMSGIEATRLLSARAPASRVLVLTISSDDDHIMEAMLAGASGYLLKDASVEELAGGIRAAAAGESSIAPKVAARLLSRVREDHKAPPPTEEGRADLSERELEVLRLLAEGKGNAEIAEALFISPKTVKNHIASILVKLQIENRIQAAVYAVKAGII
jgi:DNA-binding NarL/FixJ family response regulator